MDPQYGHDYQSFSGGDGWLRLMLAVIKPYLLLLLCLWTGNDERYIVSYFCNYLKMLRGLFCESEE